MWVGVIGSWSAVSVSRSASLVKSVVLFVLPRVISLHRIKARDSCPQALLMETPVTVRGPWLALGFRQECGEDHAIGLQVGVFVQPTPRKGTAAAGSGLT